LIQFAEAFPDKQIVHALRAQLTWSHFRELIAIKDPLKREFYAEMCRIERWSTRTLQDQIKRLVYERTAVSKKPEKVIRAELSALRDEDRLTPDLVFRDPYFLDFLHVPEQSQERELERAILQELEAFILELGTDFAFVARQKRISVDADDYYLDLLFYHRRLRRLVAIDLKMGRFQAADKGQMELYLRWLEENETHTDEEPPIGLILCAGKSDEQIRLLRLEQSGIRVAEYLRELPPQELIQRKLHDMIRLARERLAQATETMAPQTRLRPPPEPLRKKHKPSRR
jgi:predicted nuclease of restriction endonuclease-like (RecB) superfamily